MGGQKWKKWLGKKNEHIGGWLAVECGQFLNAYKAWRKQGNLINEHILLEKRLKQSK